MRAHAIVAALAVAQSIAAAPRVAPDFAPPAPGSYELPQIGPAGDGAVVTSTGEETTLHRLFRGRLVVLSLIYTRCAEARGCPWATAVLADLRRRLKRADPRLAEQVRLVTLSFDPEHDTPEIMRRYAEPFAGQGDWTFATTASPRALAPILAVYEQRLIHAEAPRGTAPPSSGYAHVLKVFVIDRSPMVRNVYSAAFLDAELLANDLAGLDLEWRARSDPGSAAGPHAPPARR